MRSLKSRLFGFGVAAFLGTIVVVGCSASGDDGDFTATDTNEPDVGDSGDKKISNTDNTDDTTPSKDAGKKDASTKDASTKDASTKDAATTPPAPETGDACKTVDEEFTRACGMCGTQQALCLPENKVSDYGVCKNQKADGCLPGATEEIACGNCGKVVRTCSKSCQWTQGACQGQPANSCSPGTVEFTDASCQTPYTYKFKTCQPACTWGSNTTTCAAPPTSLQAASTVGSTNTTLVLLNSANTLPRIPSGTCPLTGTFSTAYSYTYIEVKNPNPKATTVSIYTTKDPSATASISTYITGYDGAVPPAATEAARRQCKTHSQSYVSASYPYGTTIAPNASISVLVQSASAVTGTGTLMLNVKTESIAP